MKLFKGRGFTLIELLIVITIIMLLAALVIVSVSGTRKSSRDGKRTADLSTIQLAMEMYKDSNGKYPTLPANWSYISRTLPQPPQPGFVLDLQPYLSPMPQDPITTSGTSFGYMVLGLGTNPAIPTSPTNPAGGYYLGALMEDPSNPSNIPLGMKLGTKCYVIWGGTATTMTTKQPSNNNTQFCK